MESAGGPVKRQRVIREGTFSSSVDQQEDQRPQPLFSFGAIADIQYADVDDRGNPKLSQRRYRNTLEVVENAVTWWMSSTHPVDFVLHAGDIIDEANARGGAKSSLEALVKVDERLAELPCDVVCLVGNHELANFSRDDLSSCKLAGKCRFVNSDGSFYYTIASEKAHHMHWRFIVLDAYDVSIFEGGPGAPLNPKAVAMLRAHNPNFDRLFADFPDAKTPDDLNVCKDWHAGLGPFSLPSGGARRWTPINGAMSGEQLQWLEREMRGANASGDRVAIFSHTIVHPGCSNNDTLMWNYEDVLQLIHDPEVGACVQFLVHGHQHSGGFYTDAHGIHHICLTSPLYCKSTEPQAAFTRIDLYASELRITGYRPSLTERQQDEGKRANVLHQGGQVTATTLTLRS